MKIILYIDTSQANKIAVTLKNKNKKTSKESEQKFGSQVLLTLINEVIQEAGLQIEDLSEIKVNTGPGSFTGIRVGVAVANALAFSLGIPVNGKELEIDLNYAA